MAKPFKTNQGASDLAGNLKELFTGATSSFEAAETAAQFAPAAVRPAKGPAAAPVGGAPVGAAVSEAAAVVAVEKAAAAAWAAASPREPATRRATSSATSTSWRDYDPSLANDVTSDKEPGDGDGEPLFDANGNPILMGSDGSLFFTS